MLSPATFIGIANATAPATPPVQPVRVLGIQPLGAAPVTPSPTKPPATAASPNPTTATPR